MARRITKKLTKGDEIRQMSDRELAEWLNQHERAAFITAIDGGAMRFEKTNIEFWTGYFGSPVGEDYDG